MHGRNIWRTVLNIYLFILYTYSDMDLCPIIYIVSKICVWRKLWHMKSGELCCANVWVCKTWCCVGETTAWNLDQGLNILGQSQCICVGVSVCVRRRQECLEASALLRNKFANRYSVFNIQAQGFIFSTEICCCCCRCRHHHHDAICGSPLTPSPWPQL